MLTNSIEENFGYCIVEAYLHGCKVVAPAGLSHDELVDPAYLFTHNDQVVDLLFKGLDANESERDYRNTSAAEQLNSMNRIVEDIRELVTDSKNR
jgi:hypothetical protein